MQVFQANPLEVLYQRRCSHIHYCTPDGLEELMSDISREVLRHHPTQIYSFIADYLDALLFTRENARVALKLIEDIILTAEIVAEILLKINVSYAEANKMARIIQRSFKRYMMLRKHDKPFRERTVLSKVMTRIDITFEEASEAAIIIQRAYRRYRLVKAAEIEQKGLNWRLAARNTIQIFNKLKATNLEREEAATRIKAAYKGYYMRKLLKKLLQEEADKLADPKIEESESALFRTKTKAALVIQKAYRSHLELKHREESAAAIMIQRRFRTFMKSKVQISAHTEVHEIPKDDEKKESPTEDEKELEAEDKAARLIQKSFRKHLKSKVQISTAEVEHAGKDKEKKVEEKDERKLPVGSNKDLDAEDRAARVIQRSFRKLIQSKAKLTSGSQVVQEEEKKTELNTEEAGKTEETEEEARERKSLEEEDKAARVLQRNFRKHLKSKLEVSGQKEVTGEGQE